MNTLACAWVSIHRSMSWPISLLRMGSVLFLFSMMISTAFATKMAAPPPEKIYSANQKYYIDFDPTAQKQNVMKNNQILWSFAYPVAFDDKLFISNNGKYIYVVRSRFVQNDDLNKPALFVFSPVGLKTQYTYNKLSVPRRYQAGEAGPIGDFWRVWRKDAKTSTLGIFLIIQTEGKLNKPILMNYGL